LAKITIFWEVFGRKPGNSSGFTIPVILWPSGRRKTLIYIPASARHRMQHTRPEPGIGLVLPYRAAVIDGPRAESVPCVARPHHRADEEVGWAELDQQDSVCAPSRCGDGSGTATMGKGTLGAWWRRPRGHKKEGWGQVRRERSFRGPRRSRSRCEKANSIHDMDTLGDAGRGFLGRAGRALRGCKNRS
jgi:hypothetical protein